MKILKSIRLNDILVKTINRMAEKERRTFSNQVECLLADAVDSKPVKPVIPVVPFSEAAILPDWLNLKAWDEFVQHRKEIKKPLTKLSTTKALKALEGLSGAEQQESINNTIQNRWTGIFPPKGGNNGKGERVSHADKVREQARTHIEELERTDREAGNGLVSQIGNNIQVKGS